MWWAVLFLMLCIVKGGGPPPWVPCAVVVLSLTQCIVLGWVVPPRVGRIWCLFELELPPFAFPPFFAFFSHFCRFFVLVGAFLCPDPPEREE